jgi:hypothetical protein
MVPPWVFAWFLMERLSLPFPGCSWRELLESPSSESDSDALDFAYKDFDKYIG